jgi:hypothetical protein
VTAYDDAIEFANRRLAAACGQEYEPDMFLTGRVGAEEKVLRGVVGDFVPVEDLEEPLATLAVEADSLRGCAEIAPAPAVRSVLLIALAQAMAAGYSLGRQSVADGRSC